MVDQPENPKKLFAIAMRGVQRFIAESETTRDLAVSSAAASLLTRALCVALDASGAEIVSPANGTDEPTADATNSFSARSLPNRVVAIHGHPEEVAPRAIAAAEQLWVGWKPQGIADAPPPELTWVSVPWTGDIASDYTALLETLNARKRTSWFDSAPIAWSSRSDPSFGICALTARYPVAKVPNQQQATPVSGVILTKRGAVKSERGFPSTSTIATRPWVLDITNAANAGSIERQLIENLRSAWQTLAKKSTRNTLSRYAGHRSGDELLDWFWAFEGYWLITDQWKPDKVQSQLGLDNRPPDSEINALRAARNALVRAASSAGIGSPPTYFAMVALDGDSIGARLSRLETLAQHSDCSGALASTAASQRGELERDFLGRLVYAGGDDVFALVAARDAVALAHRARELIVQGLSPALESVTASGAVLYLHATSPLQGGVRSAQELVKEAKAVSTRKDRLLLAERRRGGLRSKTSFSMSDPLNAHRFATLVSEFEEQRLSPGVIGELARHVGRHRLAPSQWSALHRSLVHRHHVGGGNLRGNTEDVASMLEALASTGGTTSGEDLFGRAEAVMTIARFLAAEAPTHQPTT